MITNEQVEAALKAWYDAGDAGNFASMFAALKAADLASAARIAALEAAIEERHRHYLELELRCRDLEAEKQAFKDGNKYND